MAVYERRGGVKKDREGEVSKKKYHTTDEKEKR